MTDSTASKRKMRQKRCIISWRGLGTGSGRGLSWGTASLWPCELGRSSRERNELRRQAMTIAAVLGSKGSAVETIGAGDCLFDAVRRLGEKRIGALPVIDQDGIVGIMSERDVIYCLRDHGPEVLDWPVARVMTAPAITADPQTDVLAALALMTQ